jgi:hypothetical protein
MYKSENFLSELRTKQETESLKESIAKSWSGVGLSSLRIALKANLKLIEQIELRNEVIQAIIKDKEKC